jgi:hypothetical protein
MVLQSAGLGFQSLQAIRGSAQVYTDVNEVISTPGFGEEVWPKGDLRATWWG